MHKLFTRKVNEFAVVRFLFSFFFFSLFRSQTVESNVSFFSYYRYIYTTKPHLTPIWLIKFIQLIIQYRFQVANGQLSNKWFSLKSLWIHLIGTYDIYIYSCPFMKIHFAYAWLGETGIIHIYISTRTQPLIYNRQCC